jgi:hypothetical protein
MRMAFGVYGLVYVMFEVIGHQLESVGWARLTSLDVAEAVTNAALVVAVVLALVVLGHLGAERFQRSMAAWHAERESREQLDAPLFDDLETITVTSWRDEPLALAAGPSWTPVSPPRYPFPEGPLDGGAPYR